MIVNALTIDFEDWFCAGNLSQIIKYQDWNKCQLRINENTYRILELLDKYKTKGTFFVLGWLAERVPNLVQEIDSLGHEIACHGYSHTSLLKMSKSEFDIDLKKALKVKKEIIGKEILGYRSPSFSLTRKTTWAFEILLENGIKYDSSVFPLSIHPDYGFPEAPSSIYHINESFVEVPLNIKDIFGFKFTFGGGGYFRLYPYFLSRYLMKDKNRQGKPFVFYLHPWEIDDEQPVLNVQYFKKFRHYYNIKSTLKKFEKVLNEFEFLPIKDLLNGNKK